MTKLFSPLFDFNNGAFIMIFIFALVIVGLVAVVLLMMNSSKKK